MAREEYLHAAMKEEQQRSKAKDELGNQLLAREEYLQGAVEEEQQRRTSKWPGAEERRTST